MNLYTNKPQDYFAQARREIEPLLRTKKEAAGKALEVGCAQGHTLEWLKRSGYCSWVAGVEPYAYQHPSNTAIDRFERLDIETALPDIPPASLDLILCLDVLEHLNNPWETMRRLSCLLKPGGRWIISVPNIRNYRILFDLALLGRFQYTDAGILDRTHLRFFTRSSLIDMVEGVGATVDEIIGTDTQRWQKRILSAIGLSDLLAKQFLLSATQIRAAA
jgi:2-polyprenyl-3-methyl-5-hydroxy-6-metoxy-1,4-benzoquinol methylase